MRAQVERVERKQRGGIAGETRADAQRLVMAGAAIDQRLGRGAERRGWGGPGGGGSREVGCKDRGRCAAAEGWWRPAPYDRDR